MGPRACMACLKTQLIQDCTDYATSPAAYMGKVTNYAFYSSATMSSAIEWAMQVPIWFD